MLLTGGSRGIGAGILGAFVEAGDRVVYTARTDSDETKDARKSGRASFFPSDLSDPDAADSIMSAAIEHLGGLDVLVYCAGIFPESPLTEMPMAEWNTVLQVNLTSAMQLLALFAAQAQHGSQAVLISSITGPKTALPKLSHYAASKAGVEGLVRAAALELAPAGITVNAVSPGTILTEALKGVFGPEGIEAVSRKIPTGRIGVPGDIAATVLFLASPGASFITGQSIVVDGGQTLVELF
ncbi:MAG: SDR family NAD(P)-dependent oxidoreductase [Rhodoglobus sp.]